MISLDEQIAWLSRFLGNAPQGVNITVPCAILATLQSIKDAVDDVVEPEVFTIHDDGHWTHLPGKDPLDQFSKVRAIKVIAKHDYDTLLSAYKRVQQEKKTVIDVYEGNLRDADKRLIFWQERAEKAEAELAALLQREMGNESRPAHEM